MIWHSLEVEPQAEILSHDMFISVYGWDRWMVRDDGVGYPLKECLGIYSWWIFAEWRRRSWLKAKARI